MFKITQWFGENPEYYNQFGLPGHEGIDFRSPHGQEIYAVASGIVYLVTEDQGNYGIQIRIQHGNGYQTIYAHLDSVNVVVDQFVGNGDIIGFADNTGNSSGNHLHFSEKQENQTYIDENDVEWPFNFRDPWHHLKRVYQNWLNQNSITGYLYANSLVLNMQNDYARCTGTLNIRNQPSSTSTLLGQVTYGTVVKIIGQMINGYYPVQTPVDIPVSNPNSNPAIGLHLRADPDNPKSSEWAEVNMLINSSSPNCIKFLHAHPQETFRIAASTLGQNSIYIIRIFQSFGNRNITPFEFYNWNKDELANRINILTNEFNIEPSNVWIEYHNEPNLIPLESGQSWLNGTQFTQWANQGLQLFKANTIFNSVKWLYPGLSPGAVIPGVRYDSTQFLQESISVGLNEFDYIGCHAYWSQNYPMNQALDHVELTHQLTNTSVVITECSINDRPSVLSPQGYGQQYAGFVNNLKLQSGVLGVTFFVGSASDPYFEPECWITESNQIKGIGQSLIDNL